MVDVTSSISSALGFTDASPASYVPQPSLPDIWEMAKDIEHTLEDYVLHLLGSVAELIQSTVLTDAATATSTIINATATFRESIQGTLDDPHVTFDVLEEELETIFMG